MLKRIPLAEIYGNPDQPRKTFDPAKLQELAASIRENGLKQPITVRPDDQGRYMIVMGERRFRACQLLELPDILCQVSKVDDAQLAIDAIIENDQRVDVEPLEQARSYQLMLDEHGFTVETLSVKLGKPTFRIEERLRLLTLTEDCQFLLAKGQITREQAWYLSGLSPRSQGKLLRAIQLGQCTGTAALKAVSDAIRAEEAQASIFDGGDIPEAPVASPEDVKTAKSFETRMEQVAAMLRSGIQDNVVTAVKRVNPARASTLADLCVAMAADLKRLETALRVAAVQLDFAA